MEHSDGGGGGGEDDPLCRALRILHSTEHRRHCAGAGCARTAADAALSLCSACQSAAYCSADCQRADWRGGHRRLCAATARASLALHQEGAAAAGASAASRARHLHCLGLMHAHGRGTPRSDARAVACWQEAAALGCAEACTNLGTAHGEGLWGLAQDWARAHSYFEQGAAGGDGLAMFNLAMRYRYGQGCAASAARFLHWLRLAADAASDTQGQALCLLGQLQWAGAEGAPLDQARARALWERAAGLGHAEAANHLGNCWRDGPGPTDAAQALRLYRRAAQWGSAAAMVNLGVAHSQGRGVPRDEAEGVRWYTRAADAGDADALSNLGNCFRDGRCGIARDAARALALYTQAAAQGHAQAAFSAGFLLLHDLAGEAGSAARARDFLRQAAGAGFAMAQLVLAQELFKGSAAGGASSGRRAAQALLQQAAAPRGAGATAADKAAGAAAAAMLADPQVREALRG